MVGQGCGKAVGKVRGTGGSSWEGWLDWHFSAEENMEKGCEKCV